MKTIKEILQEAKALIANPENWTQGVSAITATGWEVHPSSAQACKFCTVGAIARVTGNLPEDNRFMSRMGALEELESHLTNGELRETCLYLNMREKAKRGHEKAFHLNGHKTEDLEAMTRDQIVFSKFLSAWIKEHRWVAMEDEQLNAAIVEMWLKHDEMLNKEIV